MASLGAAGCSGQPAPLLQRGALLLRTTKQRVHPTGAGAHPCRRCWGGPPPCRGPGGCRSGPAPPSAHRCMAYLPRAQRCSHPLSCSRLWGVVQAQARDKQSSVNNCQGQQRASGSGGGGGGLTPRPQRIRPAFVQRHLPHAAQCCCLQEAASMETLGATAAVNPESLRRVCLLQAQCNMNRSSMTAHRSHPAHTRAADHHFWGFWGAA